MRRLRVAGKRAAAVRMLLVACLLVAPAAAAGCGDGGDAAATGGSLDVVTSATFLADIAQNVAGERFTVRALVPADADLHAYEPTPHDLAGVAGADLFIVNGAGMERALEDTVRAAGGEVRVVEASDGLTTRTPQAGEPQGGDGDEPADGATSASAGDTEAAADDAEAAAGDAEAAAAPDPHFWLDPTLVETYVTNIRDAFAAADPEGAAAYEANAAAYVTELRELDRWIAAQVETLPSGARLLVMNHVSHGYFADRYGFTIVGAVIPSVDTADSPTARQLSDLTRVVRETGVKAIFVELGQSPKLAEQIAAETGIAVVADLRDHSLSAPDGEAATYIEMMKYDTRRIVEALR